MNETQLRAFVRGYWENADHETKKGEPQIYIPTGVNPAMEPTLCKDSIDRHADYWYERGIKDLAEIIMAKIGEKK